VVRGIIADRVVLCLFGVWLWSLPVKIGLDVVMFREMEIRRADEVLAAPSYCRT